MNTTKHTTTPLNLFDSPHIQLAAHLTTQYRWLCDDLIGIRQHRNITPEQVADAIGMPPSSVTAFENDPHQPGVTIEFLLRYAHAVGAQLTIHTEMTATIT